MQRRSFVKLSLLFAGSLAITGKLHHISHPLSPIARSQGADYRAVQQRLRHLFKQVKSARAIGNEYLRSSPGSLDVTSLVDNLCTSCEQDIHTLTTLSDRALRDQLNECQQQDFAQGKTVRVNGWILSQTEVELYALLALS